MEPTQAKRQPRRIVLTIVFLLVLLATGWYIFASAHSSPQAPAQPSTSKQEPVQNQPAVQPTTSTPSTPIYTPPSPSPSGTTYDQTSCSTSGSSSYKNCH